jgi:hypothetical protein
VWWLFERKIKGVFDLLRQFNDAGVFYRVGSVREEAIMIGVRSATAFWEIEFLDGRILYERFNASGPILDRQAFIELVAEKSDQTLLRERLERQLDQWAVMRLLREAGINFVADDKPMGRVMVEGAIMIEAAVPGERWEIDLQPSGEIEVERFRSEGCVRDFNARALAEVLAASRDRRPAANGRKSAAKLAVVERPVRYWSFKRRYPSVPVAFFDLLRELNEAGVFYRVGSFREDGIMVEIRSAAAFWEIEFLSDGKVIGVRFDSHGPIVDGREFFGPAAAETSSPKEESLNEWTVLRFLRQVRANFIADAMLMRKIMVAGAVMIEAAVPKERWEIDILPSDEIQVEIFSEGDLHLLGPGDLAELLAGVREPPVTPNRRKGLRS